MEQTGNIVFSETALLTALAIVNVFETSRPLGDPSAVAVLDDGAGISYGISQFTHRSGALAGVLLRYLETGGEVGRAVIEENLPLAKRRTAASIRTLAADGRFRSALRAAGLTSEMRAAQRDTAYTLYLRPAIDACRDMGFVRPLSLAVIYDSINHGSWERIASLVARGGRECDDANPPRPCGKRCRHHDEQTWIAEYVKRRDAWLASIPRLGATRYRTRFFLNQISLSNWELKLPISVNGVKLTGDLLTGAASGVTDNIGVAENSTAGPDAREPLPSPQQGDTISPRISAITSDGRSSEATAPSRAPARPPKLIPASSNPAAGAPDKDEELIDLDRIEKRVNAAAAKYDQVERIATTVTTRNDAAKSLWTTVAGSLSQTFWALFGLIAGIPREVWLVVAVIAAALMLLYLYRQIELGKIRERFQVSSFGFQVRPDPENLKRKTRN